jgi:hypothetical protein
VTQKKYPLSGGDYVRSSTGLRQVEKPTASAPGKTARRHAGEAAHRTAPHSAPAAPAQPSRKP